MNLQPQQTLAAGPTFCAEKLVAFLSLADNCIFSVGSGTNFPCSQCEFFLLIVNNLTLVLVVRKSSGKSLVSRQILFVRFEVSNRCKVRLKEAEGFDEIQCESTESNGNRNLAENGSQCKLPTFPSP